jgi:hypothetical protein
MILKKKHNFHYLEANMLAACDADAFCFVNFSCTDYEKIQRFC